MADMNTIKDRIKEVIRPNGVGAITATEHQALLLEVVDDINQKKADDATLQQLAEEKVSHADLATINGQRIDEGGNIEIEGGLSDEEKAELNEKIDSKADKNGKYADLTAGDLYGHGESVEAEFSFRASGGKSIKDGTAYIKEVHGNAVVWNQLVQAFLGTSARRYLAIGEDGYTIEVLSEPADKWVACSSYIDGKANHKYLLSFMVVSGNYTEGETRAQIFNKSLTPNSYLIATLSEDQAQAMTIRAVGCDGMKYICMAVDLTKAFPNDWENINTIEDFYKLLPSNIDINAYNEGEVIPFNAEGIKSVGDNAWDEEWEVGSMGDNNGNLISSSNTIRSKNYIKAIGGNEYYLGYFGNATTWCRVHYYDAEKKWIGSIAKTVNASSFIPPLNCAYMKFRMGDGYGTTYNHDITLSLYHSGWKAEVDNTYKPYWADTLNLQRIKEAFPNGMYRAGGAYDVVRYNAETKEMEGVKVIGEANLWDLKWYKDSSKEFYKATIGELGIANSANILCSNYMLYSHLNSQLGVVNGIGLTGNYLLITDLAYTTEASFRAMLQEKQVKLYYELAEPIVTPLGEFEMDYMVADFGTEEIIGSEPSAPFSGRTIYQFNAVDQIRENYNEIQELKAIIAAMQTQLANLTTL